MTNLPHTRGQPATPPKSFRERAEEMLRTSRSDVDGIQRDDVRKLVHELQVHQIELEMQNEELRRAQVELAESRDRFSDLYEFAPVGYLTLDKDGQILEANLTAAKLLGVDRKNLVGAQLANFVGRPSQDDYYRHRRAVFSSDARQVCELEMQPAGGPPLAVRLESIASDTSREPQRECRTALIDVTERKQAADELRQSEMRYRTLFNTLIEGFCIIELIFDAHGNPTDYRILESNPAFEQQTGLHNAQGRLIRDLVPGLESYWFESFGRIALTGEPARFVNEAKALNRWYDVCAFRFGGAESRKVAVLFNDITESRHAEELVHEREARLAAILNTASDAIITIDERGVIIAANRATERLFGYSPAELNGQNVSMLMPPPYRDEHNAYLARYLRTGEARIIGTGRELVGQRKDGSIFPLDLAVSEIDHQRLFTGIVRDISERKALQKHVLEIVTEEQRRIGRELHDGTYQELTGLTLIAGTLRDVLRSLPVCKSNGHSIRRLNEPLFEQLRDMATSLCQNLGETGRRVRELAHGIMPVQIDAEGLRSALEGLAASTDNLQGMTCRFDCAESVTFTNNTAATHLYRIAQEAINNALRHSQANQIRISLFRESGQIILEVTDNGTGIDLALAGKGAAQGIGLQTMQYRAGIIGGLLKVKRAAEGGTVVRCEIPGGGGSSR